MMKRGGRPAWYAGLLLFLLLSPAYAATPALVAGVAESAGSHPISDKPRDAWLQGRLEAIYAFNRHLNPFDIRVYVEDGVVNLSGVVGSGIERDLAGEIARGLEQVNTVENALKVVEGAREKKLASRPEDDAGSFEQFVTDVSITATVKSKLLANSDTGGMDIDVDTDKGVVSLQGEVASEAEKQLAGEIATSSDNVREVRNRLTVTGR